MTPRKPTPSWPRRSTLGAVLVLTALTGLSACERRPTDPVRPSTGLVGGTGIGSSSGSGGVGSGVVGSDNGAVLPPVAPVPPTAPSAPSPTPTPPASAVMR